MGSVENLSNLVSAEKEWQASGIEKIFISNVAFYRRISAATISNIALDRTISAATIKSFKKKIVVLRKENSLGCVDNTNILISALFNNGLHLLETGKCLLSTLIL